MESLKKEDILDAQHWKFPEYRQRMYAKYWRQLILNGDDRIIFQGRVTKLIGKNLGCGVYEVYKEVTQ